MQADGAELGAFPTLKDLEAVENYVFGVRPPSLAEVSALASGDMMAVVVYATEYRPGVDTVHRKHADLCFARTGVARVGTDAPLYDPRSRGFRPFREDNDHAFGVLPVRYSAWIAVQRPGNEIAFGPMRFSFRARHPELFRRPGDPTDPDDGARTFWVPLHKLFSGPECLQGFDLDLSLEAHHVNEKIRRIHLELARRGVNAGWSRPQIDQPPFRFAEGIAALSIDADMGQGVLVPVPHLSLVEEAVFQGQPLTFLVPDETTLGSRTDFLPTLEITANGPRHAPEYVHARTAPAEPTPDLNDLADPAARVGQGNYRAQHYVDFTGDGWVAAVCPQLGPHFPRFIAAYSLVSAPGFFYNCDQRGLMDWWLQRAPAALRNFLWETPPFALCDERMVPNLKLNNVDFQASDSSLPRAGFRPKDDTVTAVISLPLTSTVQDRPLVDALRDSHNPLPDGAAGVFAPGWDTSWDTTQGVSHLAAYGLGSPFPEDSKLCAALSTFWPAAAPDTGRSFSQVFATVSPLTDEEIGTTGSLPWDGVPGPRLTASGGAAVVEYASFDHVDYVKSAFANKLSLALTRRIDLTEYVSRVLAMARAYEAVGVPAAQPNRKTEWEVLSFRHVAAQDADVTVAFQATGKPLGGTIARFELYQPSEAATQPDDFRKRFKRIANRRVLLLGGDPFVLMKADGQWRIVHV